MYPARDKLQYVIKAWWKVAWQKAGKTLPIFFFANEHNNTNMKPQAKKQQLLDEVFVISRIIKVGVGVISRSRRLRLITLTETLIINGRFRRCWEEKTTRSNRMDFRLSKQLLCHLRRSSCVCDSLSSTTFRCLAWSTKHTWKSCFRFLTDGKQHKLRELYMITLRNHAPRSYMTWLPVTLSVLDMIFV